MSLPTWGAVMILNASAANGSSVLGLRLTGSPLRSTPSTGGSSSGDGMYQQTASSRGCTPLFLKAVPLSTGTTPWLIVASRRAARMSSGESSSPSRYFSMTSSLVSEITSMSCWR